MGKSPLVYPLSVTLIVASAEVTLESPETPKTETVNCGAFITSCGIKHSSSPVHIVLSALRNTPTVFSPFLKRAFFTYPFQLSGKLKCIFSLLALSVMVVPYTTTWPLFSISTFIKTIPPLLIVYQNKRYKPSFRALYYFDFIIIKNYSFNL